MFWSKQLTRGLCGVIMSYCLFIIDMSCYAKVFVVAKNDIPIDIQLEMILSEVDNILGDEDVTIKIRGGYYYTTKTIDINTNRHRIIIEGTGPKQAIISGSVEVNGWEVLPNGMWRCRIPSISTTNYIPDQLYVNGERAIRSRTPNTGVFILKGAVQRGLLYGAVLDEGDIKVIGEISESDEPVLSIYRKWAVSKRHLKQDAITGDTLLFTGKEFFSNNKLAKSNKVVIENTLNGIDVSGEWCATKDGFIYYYPKKGEEINNTNFRVPVVERLLRINSSETTTAGVIIRNIIFEHTSYPIPQNGTELDQAAAPMSAAIEADNMDDFVFENCEIRNISNYGIWLRKQCSNSIIKKSFFHNLGGGAIKIGPRIQDEKDLVSNNIIIDNNIIYNYGVVMESSVGILLLNASDCTISHNDIHFGNYTGISLGWVWGYAESPSKNNEVAYNRISHIGDGRLNDLSGIYTLGKSEGTHIHHNLISYVKSGDYRGWGIYADEGTTGVTIENNIVQRCTSGGFHQHYGSDNNVTNNIFAFGEKSQITLTGVKEKRPLNFSRNIIIMESGQLMSGESVGNSRYNIFENCYWNLSDELPKVGNLDFNDWIQNRDTTSIYQDPLFKDPLNGNFHFRKGTVRKRIGFESIDCSKAGSYGKRKWKRLGKSYV